jgi:phosphoribosyl-AMP cyclohydrolase
MGLIPCVVQEAKTKQVLLLERVDGRTFERRISTGVVHHFAQHRTGIWRRDPRPTRRNPVREMLLNDEQNCLLLVLDVKKKITPSMSAPQAFIENSTGINMDVISSVTKQNPRNNKMTSQ